MYVHVEEKIVYVGSIGTVVVSGIHEVSWNIYPVAKQRLLSTSCLKVSGAGVCCSV